jgi:hypothetical protein
MKVTREVIQDLLPVYFAGEASSDTRQLIESFFQHDPEFARDAQARIGPQMEAIPAALPADHETRTLGRTRRIVRLRGWLFGFALFCTLLPFSFAFTDRIQWFMWRDTPELAIPSLCAGIMLWIVYFAIGRRLQMGL